jgi:predicted ATPase
VSSRQDLERKITSLLEHRFPGSIVFLDEATMGLSPWRQEEYIRQLHKIAEEKNFLIIAPENSGYAWEGPYNRIHLNEPEKGLQAPNARQPEHTPVQPLKESGELLGAPSIEFRIDKDKLSELAQSYPRFAAMLETFQRLPDHLKFSHGKTEIYADNGDGKTTLLNTMYLLAKIEKFAGGSDNDSPTPQERKESLDYILNSRQVDDKLFIQSSGLAAELIRSGAITLGDHETIPDEGWSGKRAVEYFNLLDLSGEITNDTFKVVGYALEKGEGETALQKAQDFEKKYRPDRARKSTRQTVESYLANIIGNEMLPGGFLFVDEIDGGMSPDRQLAYSDQIHKLAKERKITIISTSNSYEGHQHPITPKLDLRDAPEVGIVPPRYAIT